MLKHTEVRASVLIPRHWFGSGLTLPQITPAENNIRPTAAEPVI